MPNMLFANNANTTLASSLTNVATTMSVTSATGFPSPTGSQYFYCTLADAGTQTTIEIVKVTAVSGTTFTIVRGQDGTTGTAFNAGDVVSLRLVRASLNDFPKLDENNTFSYAPTFNTALAVGSGGTGVTASTGANSVVLRDSNQNVFANNFIPNTTFTVASSTPINLTVASAQYQVVTGTTTSQTFNMPDATTLTVGDTFYFNNNITYSSVQINAHDGTTSLLALQAGGAAHLILLTNSTSNGTWDIHSYVPSTVSWGTATLNFNNSSSISGSVSWQGNVIGASYGGTGEAGTLTGILYGNGTSAHTVATTAQLLSGIGTLPVTNGGTGLTSLTAGYIPYGNGTGALSSSSNLTFNGTNLSVNGGISSAGRIGSSDSFFASAGASYLFADGGAVSYVSINSPSAGAMRFQVAATSVEAMRIAASGGVSIGNTTDPGATNLSVTGITQSTRLRANASAVIANSQEVISAISSGAAGPAASFQNSAGAVSACVEVWNTETSGNNLFINFDTEGSYTPRGNISYNRTAGLVSYNTTSDIRLKTNIQSVELGAYGSIIDSIPIVSYNWKETNYSVRAGVIAQIVQPIIPECVNPGDDEETIKQTWGVDMSGVIPMLINEIQSLRARLKAANIA